MKFISQKQPWKKIVLAVLTTAVVAPLATPSAQAAPPDYAPAHGYRNKDDKKADKAERKAAKKANKVIRDRDSDGYDDRDKDRDGDLDEEDGYDYRETPRYQKQYGDNEYSNDNSRDFRDNNRNGIEDRYESEYRNGRSTTLTGVIVRDLPGNRFEIRTSNNRTYRVMTRSNEPLRLTRGDQVSISGRIVGNNRIIIADRVRIIRALEIHQLTGRPASEHRAQHAFAGERYPHRLWVLMPEREQLYGVINHRAQRMFDEGLLEETRALIDRGYREAAPMRAVGYSQALLCLDGQMTRDEAVADTAMKTRHYAKRQFTWFKKEPGAKFVLPPYDEVL